MALIMVLNDRETWTSLEGCMILEVDDDDMAEEDYAFDISDSMAYVVAATFEMKPGTRLNNKGYIKLSKEYSQIEVVRVRGGVK
jgi:hypothetical protein